MPKVSIIIPVYNVEKYLYQCLESVEKQTLKDIEVIVVDDGSPDESYKVYQEFEKRDSRFKTLRKEMVVFLEQGIQGLNLQRESMFFSLTLMTG